MPETTVINVMDDNPNADDCVYIGRGSKWGNPFKIGMDGTRERVIRKYETYLLTSVLMNDLHELKGKRLVCFCSPLACHGDILAKYADAV